MSANDRLLHVAHRSLRAIARKWLDQTFEILNEAKTEQTVGLYTLTLEQDKLAAALNKPDVIKRKKQNSLQAKMK